MREQNLATTMNRRELLRLSMAAVLLGTSATPDITEAMQSAEMKAVSLPELPPKPSKSVAAKLFPSFEQIEVRTSGATIPVVHKGDGPAGRSGWSGKADPIWLKSGNVKPSSVTGACEPAKENGVP